MKTFLFSLLITLGVTQMIAQPINTRQARSDETAKVWVWSIQGQATYQVDGIQMARPLSEGQELSSGASIWVSEGGEVYLLCKGTSKNFGGGIHKLSTWTKTIDGAGITSLSDGVTPNPDPTYDTSRRRNDDGSGFGQGVNPPPSSGGRSGNDGSGFGQGVNPPPSSGGRSGNDGSGFGDGVNPPPVRERPTGNDGSGFGDGVNPPPVRERPTGNDGSGFGDGVNPPPVRERPTGNEGSGFGDGLTPPPDLGTRDRDSRRAGGSGGVESGLPLAFVGAFGGKVTAGPIYYRWTHPGSQTCTFTIAKPGSSSPALFQINTGVGGMTIDLRDIQLVEGEAYVASVSMPDKSEMPKAQVTFQVVSPEIQVAVLEKAEQNKLYAPATPAHQLLLKAMELEMAGLLAAASTHYQRASDIDSQSELVNAMVYTFKKKYNML